MTKEEIRNETLERRRNTDSERRAQLAMHVFERAHKHRCFQLAQHVHIYRSTSNEVDTLPFIEYAWSTGKQVFCPVVTSNHTLIHVLVSRETSWITNEFGVLEPADQAVTVAPDFFTENSCIIVPLVAFDRSCNRVGYGGGYYDRFLAQTSAIPIGIAFECQRVSSIPTTEHDIPLHGIATELRWYKP